jgi:hypothetical protein
MSLFSRDSLLGATDLTEREIELPSIGGSVRIRSLPAAYSNQANSEATEVVNTELRGRQQQTIRLNSAKLEALKVLHALVEPKLNSIEDAYTFSQRVGTAWVTLVKAIDDISGIEPEAIESTEAMFHPDGSGEAGENGNGAGAGHAGPGQHVRIGA